MEINDLSHYQLSGVKDIEIQKDNTIAFTFEGLQINIFQDLVANKFIVSAFELTDEFIELPAIDSSSPPLAIVQSGNHRRHHLHHHHHQHLHRHPAQRIRMYNCLTSIVKKINSTKNLSR